MQDADKHVSGETETPPEEKSFFNIIVHSFFIVPFLIAVFCVLLFAGINLLTRENRTVYDYLEDIKTGGLTKRWQGAFELSKILANPKLLPEEDRFYAELSRAFEDSGHDDPRVRQYLALAMGRAGRPEFVDPLIKALEDRENTSNPSIIYALGMLKDPKATQALIVYLDYPDPRIRSIATVAVGNIGSPEAVPFLRAMLLDGEPNVQWGAAISLAKMNDGSGREILAKLLDRQYLSQFPEVDGDEQTNLMISAINASSYLKDPFLFDKVRELSQSDPNMNVRAEAMKVVNP